MAMSPAVSYIPYTTSLTEQTIDTITFTQLEEGNLLSETCDDAENGDKSDDDSIMPPLISEEEVGVMDSRDESEDEPISTEMLEDICDVIKSQTSFNRGERHD